MGDGLKEKVKAGELTPAEALKLMAEGGDEFAFKSKTAAWLRAYKPKAKKTEKKA